MRRYLAVGLALAFTAGCSGSGGGPSPSDAGGDADALADHAADAVPDAARGDTGGSEIGAAPDVRDAATTDAGARPDADGAVDLKADVPPDLHISSVCDLATQTLSLPSGPIAGVLTGPSRNPAVSCHSSVATGGPDVFLSLTLSAFTVVDLRVDSPIDTLIAVRTGCGDNVAEVGCGDLPPQPDATDAGTGSVDAAASNLRTSSLRVGLPAGSFTVIIDSLTLGSLTAAPFTLTARAVQPAANATCSAPTLLTPTSPSAHGKLDLAGQPATGCSGGTGGALFYTVGVPGGQRLTARATPSAGDQGWMPHLTAFASCGSTTCLAQGHAAAGTTQQLDWVNNGTTWRLLTFSVSADGPVSGAEFDLTVDTTDLLASCARPTPVHDGSALTGQNLLDALPSANPTCEGQVEPALYYSVTLLPQQHVTATVTAGNNQSGFFGIGLRTSCTDVCSSVGNNVTTTNSTSQTETIIIEVTAPLGVSLSTFELDVSEPPPPANISVTPTGGLVTSEAGGTATFQVALTSPPAASVGITLTSNTPTEGTVSPSALAFDATNWSVPQTVTVTGVDDQLPDGPRKYTIVTAPAVSADTRYANLDAPDVQVTNLDDDPGVLVEGADDLVTSEDGSTATFTVRLNAKPTADVTVPLASSDLTEGTVSPASLTFSTTSWNLPQLVTVKGVDDTISDGGQTYAVTLGPLTSADANYGGQHPAALVAHNKDDDFSAVTPKLLSGTHTCTFGSHVPIGVDDAGTLYILMACDSELALVTSTNGGVTFSDLLPLPDTADAQGEFSLTVGRVGVAQVLFASSETGGLFFTRSTDGGHTWSKRLLLSDQAQNPLLAAAGDTVVALASGPGVLASGNPNTLIRRSTDGGLSFLAPQFVDGQIQAAFVQPDATSVWLIDTNQNLSGSTDAGATFNSVGAVNGNGGQCCYLVGSHDVYAVLDSEVALAGLLDTTQGGDFTGPAGSPLAATIDDTDLLTIFGTDGNNRLVGSRFGADKSLSAPTVLGPAPSLVGAALLSRKAVALVSFSGSFVLYSTTLWP